MIVEIKEYSFRTGCGIAKDVFGNIISFTYKDLKDQKAIPVGGTAEYTNRKLSPVGSGSSLMFYLYKQFKHIGDKLWR